jgi:hypothetical protein
LPARQQHSAESEPSVLLGQPCVEALPQVGDEAGGFVF